MTIAPTAAQEDSMSYQQTPDGGYAEASDEHHSQPRFLARTAIVMAVVALLFAILSLIGMSTHPAVFY
jgi:hypothetical protein